MIDDDSDILRAALEVHINRLSPNLLRAYVIELMKDAPENEIKKLVVAFRAQNIVQRG